MTYRLTDTNMIVRIEDDAFIPVDSDNIDYQVYLQWLSDGNIPGPYVSPDQPPVLIVTMRQARLALLQVGLLANVEDAISLLSEPTRTIAQIEWEYSQEVHRNKGIVQVLATQLNLTENDLDLLFLSASQL